MCPGSKIRNSTKEAINRTDIHCIFRVRSPVSKERSKRVPARKNGKKTNVRGILNRLSGMSEAPMRSPAMTDKIIYPGIRRITGVKRRQKKSA